MLGLIAGILIVTTQLFEGLKEELLGKTLLAHVNKARGSAVEDDEMAHRIQDLLLFFEVIIIPPIIYESSLTMIKNIRMFTRVGTILITSVINIMLSIAAFSGVILIFHLFSKQPLTDIMVFVSVIV